MRRSCDNSPTFIAAPSQRGRPMICSMLRGFARFFHAPARRPIGTRTRLILEALESRVVPSAFTWTGAGMTNLASTAANWSPIAVPGPGDSIGFDGTATTNAVFDPAFTGSVAQMQVQSSYTG